MIETFWVQLPDPNSPDGFGGPWHFCYHGSGGAVCGMTPGHNTRIKAADQPQLLPGQVPCKDCVAEWHYTQKAIDDLIRGVFTVVHGLDVNTAIAAMDPIMGPSAPEPRRVL